MIFWVARLYLLGSQKCYQEDFRSWYKARRNARSLPLTLQDLGSGSWLVDVIKSGLHTKKEPWGAIIPWLSWSQDIVGEQPAPRTLIPTAKNPREQEQAWAPVTLPHKWDSMTPHRALWGKPQPVHQGAPVTTSPYHERVLITPQTRRSLPSRKWSSVWDAGGGHFDCRGFTTCFRDKSGKREGSGWFGKEQVGNRVLSG